MRKKHYYRTFVNRAMFEVNGLAGSQGDRLSV